MDLGKLMLSLCYLPTAGRLTVTVIKARNLKAMDITGSSGNLLGTVPSRSSISGKITDVKFFASISTTTLYIKLFILGNKPQFLSLYDLVCNVICLFKNNLIPSGYINRIIAYYMYI